MRHRSRPGDEAKGDMPVPLEIIETLKKEFKIDDDRIYALRHSMGGFRSWTAICENPDMFAAAIQTRARLLVLRTEPQAHIAERDK